MGSLDKDACVGLLGRDTEGNGRNFGVDSDAEVFVECVSEVDRAFASCWFNDGVAGRGRCLEHSFGWQGENCIVFYCAKFDCDLLERIVVASSVFDRVQVSNNSELVVSGSWHIEGSGVNRVSPIKAEITNVGLVEVQKLQTIILESDHGGVVSQWLSIISRRWSINGQGGDHRCASLIWHSEGNIKGVISGVTKFGGVERGHRVVGLVPSGPEAERVSVRNKRSSSLVSIRPKSDLVDGVLVRVVLEHGRIPAGFKPASFTFHISALVSLNCHFICRFGGPG